MPKLKLLKKTLWTLVEIDSNNFNPNQLTYCFRVSTLISLFFSFTNNFFLECSKTLDPTFYVNNRCILKIFIFWSLKPVNMLKIFFKCGILFLLCGILFFYVGFSFFTCGILFFLCSNSLDPFICIIEWNIWFRINKYLSILFLSIEKI